MSTGGYYTYYQNKKFEINQYEGEKEIIYELISNDPSDASLGFKLREKKLLRELVAISM